MTQGKRMRRTLSGKRLKRDVREEIKCDVAKRMKRTLSGKRLKRDDREAD